MPPNTQDPSPEPVTPDVTEGGRPTLAFKAFDAMHLAKTLIYRPDFFVALAPGEHQAIVSAVSCLSDAMKHLEDVIGLNGWDREKVSHLHNW